MTLRLAPVRVVSGEERCVTTLITAAKETTVCIASQKKSKIMGTAVSFRWQKMLVKKVENMGNINATEIGRDF